LVRLVLNPNTGHVSTQFHLKYDDVFETVKHGRWKSLCGFTSSDENTSHQTKINQLTATNPTITNHITTLLPIPRHDFEGEIPPEPPPPLREELGEDPFTYDGDTEYEGD
jgi:hypothetical protein